MSRLLAVERLPKAFSPPFKLVAVAEDDPVNLETLSRMLALLGYDRLLCTNCQEMLTHFLTPGNGIPAIIMDRSMPIMDGLEATRCIREIESNESVNNGARIPIIALSGNALNEQVMEAFTAGVSDYLLKPTKKVDLTRKMQYCEHIVHAGLSPQPMLEAMRAVASSAQ